MKTIFLILLATLALSAQADSYDEIRARVGGYNSLMDAPNPLIDAPNPLLNGGYEAQPMTPMQAGTLGQSQINVPRGGSSWSVPGYYRGPGVRCISTGQFTRCSYD